MTPHDLWFPVALWGHKTHAVFDVWSIEHFLMGMNVYFAVRLLKDTRWFAHAFAPTLAGRLMAVLLVSCFWEIIEFYLEAGYVHPWATYWFQGIEHPLNRFVSDPAMMLLGGWFASRCVTPLLVPIAARVFSLAWLYLHLFLLPHSMKLQESLAEFFN
jgi:hypothetical protein